MKRAVAVLLVGIAVAMIQGAVNPFVPAGAMPDFGLLIVLALGLRWRDRASGFAIASALGFVTDLLSGSLLGEQALLHMFAFGMARVSSGHLNLRGAFPQAVFAVAFTLLNALGVAALNRFFTSSGGIDLVLLRDLPLHAAVNALFAPLVTRAIETLSSALGDEESGRRQVHLPARGRPV